jgi:hypothetical protein
MIMSKRPKHQHGGPDYAAAGFASGPAGAGRQDDDDPEAVRREQLHKLRMWAAHGPSGGPKDPIHVIRMRLHDSPPEVVMFGLARWSLIARLVADAAGSGDQVEDLGPDALLLAQAANRGDFGIGELVIVGIARGPKWLQWNPPAPVEAVPGSPGAAASAN